MGFFSLLISLPNRNDMDSVTAGEAATAPPPRSPHPATILGPKELPPAFVSKTYDMVEDQSTDEIISWSPMNNSFVVWNPTEFGRDLLPKYFKHNNFSSFVRQLNTYGFRKVDPDRCEFANEGFLRGHKHLLKSISRRKSAQGQQGSSSIGVSVSSPCVEVGKFGIEEEVEQLKRDKNVLIQELVKLRQQQQSTDIHLQNMVKRQQSMESRQQLMMCFLAKAVQNPVLVSQLIQKQGDGSMRVNEGNKKRRLREDSENRGDCWAASDGQIVKYQPFKSDSMIWNIMKTDDDKVPIDDGVSSPNRGAGVSLQEEAPTTSGQSRAAGQCVSYLPSTSTSLPDTVMPTIPPLPESTQVIINDIPTENYMDTEKNNPFFDCGSVSIQPDEILQDPNMSELMSNCDLLEEYLAQSPVLENNNTNGGSLDKFIEELDLLTSEKTEQL